MVIDRKAKLLSQDEIREMAIKRWDSKTPSERLKASSKYKHIFIKHNLPSNDWTNAFNDLTDSQKSILLKGELIRTYDAMSNHIKSKIKSEFGLTEFSSKWFKLSPKNKKKLLTSVLGAYGEG